MLPPLLGMGLGQVRSASFEKTCRICARRRSGEKDPRCRKDPKIDLKNDVNLIACIPVRSHGTVKWYSGCMRAPLSPGSIPAGAGDPSLSEVFYPKKNDM